MRKLALFFLGLGLTYAAAPAPAHSASGPSAWVYVSSQIGTTSNSDVYGFTAASNGKLTLISTAPLATNLSSMAVNGLYLFGAQMQGSNIDSFHIESDGKLTYSKSKDVSTNNCGNAPFNLVLDHTGQTLYDLSIAGDSICANNVYQAWSIEKSNGALSFLDAALGVEEATGLLTFVGNNEYAYTADCYHFDAAVSGFKRASKGPLTQLNFKQVFPSAPKGVGGYCVNLAAADPTNHLAIAVQLSDGLGSLIGPVRLATYTVNSNGSISTKSTDSNMPGVAAADGSVFNVTALAMSPSGKLLAVAGTNGLQVFHFNGAGPITKYTGLLSTAEIDQIFWDKDNHLYAIGTSSNKLAVFTVTPTSWKYVETYKVNKPVGLIVQPLPLP